MEKRRLHANLKTAMQLVDGISQMLGSRYEVILHDLSHVESSIIAIKGNITNREVGGPVTNYLLQHLKKYGDDAPNRINYRNKTPDGRVLRSTTILIRDEKDHIIGSLCINQDLTDYIVASKLAGELVSFKHEDKPEAEEEVFAHEINEVMGNMVDGELEKVSKPVAYMQKEDKMLVVGELVEKGLFDIKGAVEYVAERLGVTNFTVYNYLKEIRYQRSEKSKES